MGVRVHTFTVLGSFTRIATQPPQLFLKRQSQSEKQHTSTTRYTFATKEDLQDLGKVINSSNRDKLKSVIRIGVQTGVQVIRSL